MQETEATMMVSRRSIRFGGRREPQTLDLVVDGHLFFDVMSLEGT
jgi:hypothetical protein